MTNINASEKTDPFASLPENIRSKLAGLQKLITGSSSPGEVDAAAFAAAALCQKYRLDMAMLETLGDKKAEVIETEVLLETGRLVTWKSTLCGVLGRAFGCFVYLRVPRKHVTQVNIVGTKSDRDMVRSMYEWLSETVYSLSLSKGWGMGATWKNSWCNGCVNGISLQMTKANDEAKKLAEGQVGMSAAIVLVSNRLAQATAEVNGDKMKDKKVNTRTDTDAFEKGKAYGQSMNINPGTKKLGS